MAPRPLGRLAAGLLAAGLLALLPVQGARAETSLALLAEVGPWPVVSRLIGYRGRLWFANSVKGVNHNSADLYSYDPASGTLRYERHLFSQDAGRPLVHDGLLYWPQEDSRISINWGDFAVTNGRDWAYGVVPVAATALAFHSHAMTRLGDDLLVATSAWRAGFQRSGDRGLTWRELYDHPTPTGRVSRVVELESLGDLVFGSLRLRDGSGLLQSDGARTLATPGWPEKRAVRALAALGGRVYGLVREADGTALWRSDGRTSEPMAALPQDGQARDLAADGRDLWLLTQSAEGGAIWRSPDGGAWTLVHRVAGGQPSSLVTFGDGIFVGGAGPDGRGRLWGPEAAGGSLAVPDGFAALPRLADDRPVPDWALEARRLDALLTDPGSYERYARTLRDLVFDLARRNPPEGFFAERLATVMPDRRLSLIGGAVEVSAAKLGRWILLWGMAVSGQGPVPVALLDVPWSAPRNRAEKYYDTLPAALWAIGETGQRDRATVTALIERLDRPDDPQWLQGDLIGALSAVTGERFGYDTAAWRAWWSRQAPTWAY